MRLILLLALSVLFVSCSGTHSTIKNGYAYQLSEDQASVLVNDIIRSNIVNDRLLPGSKLVASGYDRSMADTHTYTATAISVPRQQAYGFEITHDGTMFKGPTKAKRMFNTLIQRASLVGTKVSIQ